jgi:glycerol-3-phosphate acyltransferase PlsX
VKGGVVGVCDSGANVDIIPEQLREFALLGSSYLECVFGIKRPRVALLNIGTESEKGDELRRSAYALLSETPEVNFVGNMESRDLLTGKYDLVVCDGFAGNVLVKSTEGTALELLKMMKGRIKSKKRYMMGAALMKDMFMELKEFMNYQNYGGSVFLGTTKTIVKGHGASDAKAVAVCVDQAYRMASSDMNEKIAAGLAAFAEREKSKQEIKENV